MSEELMDRQYSPLHLHRLRYRPAAWLRLTRILASRDFVWAACVAIVVAAGGLERWNCEQRYRQERAELAKANAETTTRQSEIADLNRQVRDLQHSSALSDSRIRESDATIDAQLAEISALQAELRRAISQRATSRER